ncbi:MAG: hypothetical protein ACLUT1_08340 [Ruminococcus sp.]
MVASQPYETTRLKLCGSIFEKLLHQKAFMSALLLHVLLPNCSNQ